jgi:hypothetical protein
MIEENLFMVGFPTKGEALGRCCAEGKVRWHHQQHERNPIFEFMVAVAEAIASRPALNTNCGEFH